MLGGCVGHGPWCPDGWHVAAHVGRVAGQDVENRAGHEVGHPEPDGPASVELAIVPPFEPGAPELAAMGVHVEGTEPEPAVELEPELEPPVEPVEPDVETNGFRSLPPLAEDISQSKEEALSCCSIVSVRLSEFRADPDLTA